MSSDSTPIQVDAVSSVVTSSSIGSQRSDGAFSSLRILLNETLVNFLITIRSNGVIIGGKPFMVYLLLHIYYLFIGFMIPTLSTYYPNYFDNSQQALENDKTNTAPFGLYGGSVWRVLNYTITLGIDTLGVPYEVLIAASSFFIIMSIAFISLVIVRFRTLYGNSLKKIKRLMHTFSLILLFVAPFACFTMTSFVDCNFNIKTSYEGSSTYALNRFPSVPCYNTGNVVLIVINFIGVFLLMTATSLAAYSLPLSIPQSTIPFVVEDQIPLVFLVVSILFRIIAMFVIPPHLLFVRGVFHFLLSISLIVLIFKTIPFFKRIENSVYCGSQFAYLGSSVGIVISPLVNTSNESFLGLGMMGLEIALIVFGFLIGLVSMEIYTRVALSRVKKIFLDNVTKENETVKSEDTPSTLDIDCSEIYANITKRGLKGALKLYIQLSVRETAHKGKSDVNLLLPFIKAFAPRKGFDSPDLLLSSSIFSINQWNDSNKLVFASYMLRKASRISTSYFTSLNVTQRTREVEAELSKHHHGKHSLEIKMILDKLEKKQEELKLIHKAFWKELTSERLNDGKLFRVNLLASELTVYCDKAFSHLIKNFPHNKTVLRYYASYLENIKLDKERGTELYEEALAIEEEESKNLKSVPMAIKNNPRNPSRFRHNRVAPNLSESSIEARRDSINSNASPTNSQRNVRTMFRDVQETDMIDKTDDLDQVLNEDDSASQHHDQDRKLYLYRNALNTPYTAKIRKSIFLGIGLLSLAVLIVNFALAIYYDGYVTRTSLVKHSCIVMTSPGATLRDIRMRQIISELFDNLKWTMPANGTERRNQIDSYLSYYTYAFQFQRDNLRNLQEIAQSGLFSEKMNADYTIDDKPIVIPVSTDTVTSPIVEFSSTYKKTASIREMTEELLQHVNSVLESKINYNETTTNYPFMYIFQNRKYCADAFYQYCSNFQDSEAIFINESKDMLWTILLTTTFTFIGFYLLAILLFRIEMEKLTGIIGLFKKIPKDIVGVIYQDLDKKHRNEEVKGLHNRGLPKPKNMILIIALLLTIVFCLTSGLFYYELTENVNRSTTANANVNSASLMIRTTNRITLRLNEMFSYLSVPLGKPVNHNSIVTQALVTQYRTDIRTFITTIQTIFSSIVFGTNTTSPITGMYPKIDEMIEGIYNCPNNSTYLESCAPLEQLISKYTIQSGSFSESFFNSYFAKKSEDVFYELLYLYNLNDIVFSKLVKFLDLLIMYTGQPTITLTSIFFVFCFISLFILNYFMYNSLLEYDEHITSFRGMLNYVPSEWIESNEYVKNFVFYNALSFFALRRNKQVGSGTINNLLHSMVDGSVLANEKGEVLLINLAAQKLFSKPPSDVMGVKFYTLFDSSSEQRLKEFIKDCRKYLDNAEGKNGEVMELTCIRKNGSVFPANANIFATRDSDNKVVIVCFIKDITAEKKANVLLSEEKKNSENLLLNILPESVAAKLKNGVNFIAEKYNDVSVFFSDMVGFTAFSSELNPSDLILMLNSIVNGFDDLTDRFGLEKIKTIGDSYFAVGGLPINPQSDHPERCLKFAIQCYGVVRRYNESTGKAINIRVGIHTGGVVAGVIGKKKFAFDLWGDTINTASRMESTSKAGRIQISRSTYERVYDLGFDFEERKVDVKGKGIFQCYLLHVKHHDNPILELDDVIETIEEKPKVDDRSTLINVRSEPFFDPPVDH